ncbi:MAG TPA: leucine-rich repeat domain-containing protein [bacterium]|nr:leucine-rich repeat domain-containing protein [bacterium]
MEDASFMEKTVGSKRHYKPISYLAKIEGKEKENNLFFSLKNGRIEELEFEIEERLPKIPSEIGNLKKLERLHIFIGSHSNNIFADEFKAESVKYLAIDCSVKDTTIPDMLYSFPNLRWLRIVGTNSRPVVKLENSFKKLHNLETLELHNVRLNELPETIVSLKNLFYIDLTCTSIKSVSVPILLTLRRTGLRSLKLVGNTDLIISEGEIKALKKRIRLDLRS